MTTTCMRLRRELGAFADGALTGAARLRVARHLDQCEDCADHSRAIVDVGEALRQSAAADGRLPSFDGMAATVISRIRVESTLAWTRRIAHVFDDWHWTIVASGSVAATLVSTLFVSAILSFGPKPVREDSLSALIVNLGSPAGTLFICTSPVGGRRGSTIWQVDNGQPAASSVTTALASTASTACGASSEADAVKALASTVTRGERVLPLEALQPAERRHVEVLLTEIARMRANDPMVPAVADRAVAVHEFRLVTATGVVAKAL